MAAPGHDVGFSDALVILGAAGLVIPMFARFRVTPIIGFILVGVLVGPSGLGSLVDEVPWLYHITITDPGSIAPFAELGIVLLLFSIGLELSFARLWAMRRKVFGLGAAELVICAALIGGALAALGQTGTSGAIALGFALALSSTALVLPMAGTTTPVGRFAFAMLLFEDLALVPIIFLLGALAPHAASDGGGEIWELLLFGTLTVALMMVVGKKFLPPLFAQAARTKSPELFLAASLLVAIAASIATAAVGLSPIVGALVAGLLIAETDYHEEVEAITAPFKGLALGVFLITVGMSVDVREIAANWPALAAAVVSVLLVKAIVTGLLVRYYSGSASVASETGLLMASPSETTLIILAAASSAQLIDGPTAAFWQTVTAIGLTLTPLLAFVGKRVAKRTDRRGVAELPDAAPSGEAPAAIILGFGRVGRLVAEMLDRHGHRYIAVDSSVDNVAAARREGFSVMYGDANRPELLDRLNLGHATSLIVTMDEPVLAVRITRRVRAWCPDLCIVVRARDAEHAAELYRAGATDAVPETLESSLQLSEAVLVDIGMAMGPVIASIHEKRAEMRQQIMEMGELDREPLIRRTRVSEIGAEPG